MEGYYFIQFFKLMLDVQSTTFKTYDSGVCRDDFAVEYISGDIYMQFKYDNFHSTSFKSF